MIDDLANFALAKFALSVAEKDGYTKRDHLNAAWQTSGIEPEELANLPPCPAQGAALWALFTNLHACRHNSGFGPLRLSARDIASECDLLRIRLEPWELKAIKRLDEAFFEVWAANQPKAK